MQAHCVKRVARAELRFLALVGAACALCLVWALAPANARAAASASATTGGATSPASATSATTAAPAAGGTTPAGSQTERPTIATWFGPGFYGSTTACGQKMSPRLVGVASRTLPCGTLVQIAYRGRRLTVPVVDRGPYSHIGATWDLTAGTARALKITETVKIRTEIVGSLPNSPSLGEPAEAEAAQPTASASTEPAAVASRTGGAVAH